ncbi:MAG: diguanylate cyclase [Spirochaetes bacterium]|nr:diguanylate cyclase [Spirochaetota bacterium]
MYDSLSDKFSYSKNNKIPLSLIIFKTDEFDKLSKICRKEELEHVTEEIISEFKSDFVKKDSIIEKCEENCFAITLVGTQSLEALHLCRIITQKISASDKFSINGEKITLSIGISSYPENANSVEDLKKEAETALQKAQENGGNKIIISKNIFHFFDTRKRKIPTIAERNRVIDNVIKVIREESNFLLLGHKEPDEDCIASMVAFSILLRKFYKRVSLLLYKEYHHKFPYLIEICKYNRVSILESEKDIVNTFGVTAVLDTPKPAMLEGGTKITDIIADNNIIKIEIDHHLGADSGYIGDSGNCFADEASSTCELIGYLAFKLNKKNFIRGYDVSDLFSRNFVLALITGMISDSKMGKYLKSARQKKFYNYFSKRYNEMLLRMTNINSNNFSSMDEIFDELKKLSDEEINCYHYFYDRKKSSKHIAYIIIDKNDAYSLYKEFKKQLIPSIARRMADDLSEESGYLSIIAYYDHSDDSDLIQLRMRRSHTFSKIDLREVLKKLKIEDGGGHPGAVGFRVKQEAVPDLKKFAEEIISKVENILTKALK